MYTLSRVHIAYGPESPETSHPTVTATAQRRTRDALPLAPTPSAIGEEGGRGECCWRAGAGGKESGGKRGEGEVETSGG